MESLDGILLIPPDRGQILGRAMWKPRYVVVGRRNAARSQAVNASLSQIISTSRIQASTPKNQSKSSSDEYVISIYKSKDEWEPSQRYPVSAVVDCQVQMLAHRKQGPVLPTLVVSITDKERKRRSSRAAGLISGKESSSTTLWFRTPPDDHHPSLHEWGRFILSRKTPISPDSPVSPTFSNPFAARPRDESFPRPSSGNPNGSTLQHKSSSQTQSSRDRDRPVTYSSESPSLRSKRSDISSPSSAAPHAGYFGLPIHGQNYTTVLPTDLQSPVATMGAYQSDSASSWTPHHGIPSAVSPSTNGRGSLDHGSSVVDSSSPPGPRETILDRAFQMCYIPGSESAVPGEEKLSSLARFDALMREADEQRLRREAAEKSEREATTSAWDADDSEDSDMDGDEEEYGHPRSDRRRDRDTLIPEKTQRALNFIVNRHSRPSSPGSPLPYDADSTASQNPDSSSRPRTGHSKHRPQTSQRTTSQTHLAPDCGDVLGSGKPSEDGTRPNLEKRMSTSSAKRRSFTEFTKRLSSTSSLLLVQSNASGGASSRGSSEYDQASPIPRSTLAPRGAPSNLKGRELEEWEKRCGWRGSVGILSAEGGFV